MNVTQKLMQEHQLILRYIKLLQSYLIKMNSTQTNEDLLKKLESFIDFIQNFADKYHHAKEENILFRYMEKPGVLTHCNPLPVMMQDHENGRSFVRGIISAVQENNLKLASENAYGWTDVLESHIGKEDNILYVMAEQGLSDEQKKKILEEYKVVERDMNGKSLESKYVQLFNDLEKFIK